MALTFVTDDPKLTLPAGLASLQGEYFINYPVLGAGLVITIIPVLIIFFLAQRYLVEGLTMGALKG
jgi:ABC-type glycerol-3-phosphate transport system permease component